MHKVTKLDISHNRFGDAGVESICAFVQNSSTLTELDLSNNGAVGDLGLQALVAAIGVSGGSVLSKVDLRKTPVSAIGRNLLQGMRMLRPKITFMVD